MKRIERESLIFFFSFSSDHSVQFLITDSHENPFRRIRDERRGPEQFPADSKPQIAFAGRSNVGKSSLINCAPEPEEPGQDERDAGQDPAHQLFHHQRGFYCVDLPGYGYAKAPRSVVDAWAPMIEAISEGVPADPRSSWSCSTSGGSRTSAMNGSSSGFAHSGSRHSMPDQGGQTEARRNGERRASDQCRAGPLRTVAPHVGIKTARGSRNSGGDREDNQYSESRRQKPEPE